jgi:GntR family transcriptional regulator/MocR family aminotransferase
MAEIRTNSGLLVVLDRDAEIPLHRQIETSIRDAIRSGRLARGASLPPSRALATDLGVSRGVVVEAYAQLTAEGYLASRSGGYTQVAAEMPAGAAAAAVAPWAPEPGLAIDLSYGLADVSNFPRAAWLRALREALADAPNSVFGYLTGSGVPQLRTPLADYLNRVRGTLTQPDHIVICTGYAQGMTLLISVLAAAGAKRIALEDPSSGDDALPAALAAGLEVVGVPVDENGIRIDKLRDSNADAVILTPAHQWPTGSVLSAGNRPAVIRWAAERGALIIEDDYDAEYRYDRTPVGALQGLAPEHVVYAGSASKTLAPGLRLGWLALPGRLVEPVAAAKIAADRGSPALDQLAFADLITRGEFDRHLRRMRPVYKRRRDALLTALETYLPRLEPTGISAGLHLVTWLPPDLDENAVVQAARRAGVGIDAVGPYRIGGPGPGGLIFGYATVNEQAIGNGIARLARAVSELSTGTGLAFAAGDGGEGIDPAAPLAAGQEPVADETDDRDDERHGEHDGTEGVQRGTAVAAVLGGVDDHRHRGVARAGGQQVDDDEVVDHAGEDQHGAGEDGRSQQREHDPAQHRQAVDAQVGGRLLVLAAEPGQPALDDDRGPAHVPGDQAQDLGPGAQVHAGEQHREDEEHRDAEDQLGDDEGQDHHEVERRGDLAAPAVDAERERQPERDRDDRGEDGQPEGLDDRRVQLRVVQHRVIRVAEIPLPGQALVAGLRLALVEREQHRDGDRDQ